MKMCIRGHDVSILGRYRNRQCKACERENKAGRKPEVAREANRRSKLSWQTRRNEVKLRFFQEQKGKCLFCGQQLSEDFINGHVVLDHDHTHNTEKGKDHRGCAKCWRGLLHSSCNSAVGRVEHSEESLATATEYLLRLGRR